MKKSHGMDPEPSTDAAALGTLGHICRNLELGADRPNTCLVDTKDSKVCWFDGVDVRVVGDSESTAP